MRGATRLVRQRYNQRSRFLLTRLMRGATTAAATTAVTADISTHAPHARRDKITLQPSAQTFAISTHAPHARRDDEAVQKAGNDGLFLLTRLMRGATAIFSMFHAKYSHRAHKRRTFLISISKIYIVLFSFFRRTLPQISNYHRFAGISFIYIIAQQINVLK